MRTFQVVLAVALIFVLCSAFVTGGKKKSVYAFGIAASFNDTVVYYTEIQVLDSVALQKGGKLPHREQYSYQLRNHMEFNMDKPNYTCMIYFSENKSKLEKEAAAMKGKYKKGRMTLELIDKDTFAFKKPEE